MPWNKKTEFHQRCDFIQQTRAPNASVARLCRHWNLSRKTAYKWIKRYRRLGGYGDDGPGNCDGDTPRGARASCTTA